MYPCIFGIQLIVNGHIMLCSSLYILSFVIPLNYHVGFVMYFLVLKVHLYNKVKHHLLFRCI